MATAQRAKSGKPNQDISIERDTSHFCQNVHLWDLHGLSHIHKNWKLIYAAKLISLFDMGMTRLMWRKKKNANSGSCVPSGLEVLLQRLSYKPRYLAAHFLKDAISPVPAVEAM